MPPDFIHNHKDFADLIEIIGVENDIAVALVEQDYWIMHCLYGLQQLGMTFELKGGTSLSKGFGIIQRFSEDIDIRIEPPEGMAVSTGRNQDKPAHMESRKRFYDWLASTIRMDGIHKVERATEYDDIKYRSGGIRLRYHEVARNRAGLKDGVLLEVGFDVVTPNTPRDISSWVYDYAASKVPVIDNRALAVKCYDPGYTLIEKLHAISRKFRIQQESGKFPVNFIRHYYDVYCLLGDPGVQAFIGSEAYQAHKAGRFGSKNPDISGNPAFRLEAPSTLKAYEEAYNSSRALYYRNRPMFSDILARIREYADRL